MIRAVLCSGQGCLKRDMLDLASGSAAAPILAAAQKMLGRDPHSLLAEADAEALIVNRTSQILCVTGALAVAASLELDAPLLVAGYSVGEMAAWSIAGFWSAEASLRLTARRAELMDSADTEGGLGFVRGLDAGSVGRLVAAHGCAISIRNPGGLLIIGGGREAVAQCCAAALDSGATAARPIPVRVASHTPRLASAVAPFELALRSVPGASAPGGRTLIGAADAGVITSVDVGLPGLARQLATTVDWNRVLVALAERGARRALELGPGNALAEMAQPVFPDIEIRAVGDFRSLAGARRWFAQT